MEWKEERMGNMKKILILIMHRAVFQSPPFFSLCCLLFDEDTRLPSAKLQQGKRCAVKIGV